MPEHHTWTFYLFVIFFSLVMLLIFSNLISLKMDRYVLYIRLALLGAAAVVGILMILGYIADRSDKGK